MSLSQMVFFSSLFPSAQLRKGGSLPRYYVLICPHIIENMYHTFYSSTTQCARSLILQEKWGVTSLIKSMHFWHLGTISSHSRAKIVSFDLLFIYYGGYQTEKCKFLLLKWLILKKYHCTAPCRDATYIGYL